MAPRIELEHCAGFRAVDSAPESRTPILRRVDHVRGDSLLNTLSGLGDPDRDKSRGWTILPGRPLDHQAVESLYGDGETLAARCVDLPVDESTKRPFHVYVDAGEAEDGAEPWADLFEEFDVLGMLSDVDRWACLYGGAALVLDVDDGRPISEPVDEARIRAIRSIRVVDRLELTRAEYYMPGDEVRVGDPVSLDRIGEVKRYHLMPHGSAGTAMASGLVDSRGAQLVGPLSLIHESRVIPFYGFRLPPRLREQRDGWGQPVLERYLQALLARAAADKAIGHILNEWHVAIMSIKGLRTIVQAPDGSKQLAARMTAFNMAKGITGMGVLDADGEAFEKQQSPVSGLADLYDRVCQSLSAITGIPVTLLDGQAPSGLSTDNEGGRINWYDNVAARQRRRYLKPIRRLCHLWRLASEGVDVPLDAKIRVEFEPLLSPSEKEQAEARKLQAETDDIYFDLGVLTPDEIRASRFGGAGYSSDTRLMEGTAVEPPQQAQPQPPPVDDGDTEPE